MLALCISMRSCMRIVRTYAHNISCETMQAISAMVAQIQHNKNICICCANTTHKAHFLRYTCSMQYVNTHNKQSAQNVRAAQVRVCCVAATVHKCDFFKQVQNIFACVTCFAVNVCYNAFTAAQKRSTVTRTVYVFSKLML